MELIRMIYASRATRAMSLQDLYAIQRGAKGFNEPNEITGLLIYGDGHFLQALEGRSTVVNRCYHDRVLPDGRHDHAHLLLVEPIAERIFPRWSFGLAQVNESVLELMKSSTGAESFQPLQLKAQAALAFLKVVADLREAKGVIT